MLAVGKPSPRFSRLEDALLHLVVCPACPRTLGLFEPVADGRQGVRACWVFLSLLPQKRESTV